MSDWVELRADGKMHGRLHTGQMILEVRHGDRTFRYDLPATAASRQPIVDRVRVNEPPGDLRQSTRSTRKQA